MPASGVRERRRARDALAEKAVRVADLDLTLDRFRRLDEVYPSDLERLAAIEEGGALLLAFGRHECPVSGAPPEAKAHGADDIALASAAASAEIRIIMHDKAELARVMASLLSEARALRLGMGTARDELRGLEADLEAAQPTEHDFRQRYEGSEAQGRQALRPVRPPGSLRGGAAEGAVVGVDGPTAHARTIQGRD